MATDDTGDDPPQNVYDDPAFFAGYTRMERFTSEWGAAMEHGCFIALMGDVSGLRLLDLGCGGGHLALYLARAGAEHVTAIDASDRMLSVARAKRADQRITYLRQTMEDAQFPPGAFDLVVSSLALHYVADYAGLIQRIASWLVPGGLLVFSTEHPVYTARAAPDGWLVGADGAKAGWVLDRYAEEGVREHPWFVDGVRRCHRTFATLVNGLIDAGLAIERVAEPVPGDAWVREHPQDAHEPRRPMFLLIRARKPPAPTVRGEGRG